ncbi:hypothetical protein ARMSODRAFT_166773 [Armillaria solidipes]|uniref:Uncharacterized protein n=1 Tax=Armillaria solidipes TaxID=1076256 RepID=A0A2H3BRB1_9AGAR|nr:hypothetical protein ARMSODRAFT_166773 [Armillaria solidipes]
MLKTCVHSSSSSSQSYPDLKTKTKISKEFLPGERTCTEEEDQLWEWQRAFTSAQSIIILNDLSQYQRHSSIHLRRSHDISAAYRQRLPCPETGHLCLKSTRTSVSTSTTGSDRGRQRLGMRHPHSSQRRHAQGGLPWKRVSSRDSGVSPLKANVVRGF